MLSEEEKNALKCLEWDMLDSKQIKMILNLIDKQQAELEKQKRLNEINEAIIEALKDKTAIQESIIHSFEIGELLGGKKYEK